MTTQLRLGGLTLYVEPCNCVGDSCTMMIIRFPSGAFARIHRDEFDVLVRTAAVLTAARRVCNRRMEHRAPNRDTFLVNDVEILGVLAAAIDALDAGGDK